VTPGYFHLLGIPVVRGRGFSDRDRKDSPRVAVINQNLARNFFDGENPIGKQLHILDGGDAAVPAGIVEIVGLTANVRDMGLDEVPFNDIYVPFSQNPAGHIYAVVKSKTASTVLPIMRRKIQALDKGQFVAEVKPFESYVREQMQEPRFNFWLMATFAGLAVLLTAVALYGTLSFALAQRTREIGIRIALGARKENIFCLLFQSIWRPALTGSICGLGVALTLGSIYRDEMYLVPYKHSGLLYGVSIHDPVSLAAAALMLLAIAGVAGIAPALRGTRVDPHSPLRCE
jgi:putative ABC transport system permease protein